MIRFAKQEDIEKVNIIRKQVNQVHVNGRPDIFKDGFNEELSNRIYEFFEQENKDIVVAEADGIICGFASIEYITKPENPYCLSRKYLHIEEFGVDEMYRRKGIGTQIFDYIKILTKEKGFCKIELDMWEFNGGTLKFYESVGLKTYKRYLEYV